MRRHSLEDGILTVILIILVAIVLWYLVGCSSVNRTATMRYKASKDCQWTVSGGETIHAEQINQEFTVGEDCTLTRKTRAGEVDNGP